MVGSSTSDDHASGAEDAHLAGVAVERDVDVLVAGRDPAVGGLDGVLEGVHELLAGDALLGVELQERADEIAVHVPLLEARKVRKVPVTKERGGHPRSQAAETP